MKTEKVYYLGLESSCDETAAAVVEYRDGALFTRSSIVASQIETHRLYGGVVPEIASRAHVEAISRITHRALDEAGITPADLTAIGVTSHPGLIGALLVGVNFAKGLAAAYDIPLVPIDHIKAHIAAAYLADGGAASDKQGAHPASDAPALEKPVSGAVASDKASKAIPRITVPSEKAGDGLHAKAAPRAPFLALAVSGGHTALYYAESPTDFRRIGSTRDDAIGEAFDKIGRLVGIPYPAGAGFDRLAAEGFCRASGLADPAEGYRAFPKSAAYRDEAYKLPSPAMTDGTLDFSFSGLKTAAINLLHRAEQLGAPIDRALFAAAYTYRAVEAIAKQTDAALAAHPGADLLVAGGVAANSHLRRRLEEVAKKRKAALHIPALSLCGDNGAMVAAATHFAYAAGIRAGDDLNASAADEV